MGKSRSRSSFRHSWTQGSDEVVRTWLLSIFWSALCCGDPLLGSRFCLLQGTRRLQNLWSRVSQLQYDCCFGQPSFAVGTVLCTASLAPHQGDAIASFSHPPNHDNRNVSTLPDISSVAKPPFCFAPFCRGGLTHPHPQTQHRESESLLGARAEVLQLSVIGPDSGQRTIPEPIVLVGEGMQRVDWPDLEH